MAPRSSRKAKSSSLMSNIWIKLLILGTLVVSVIQLVLHSHHDPVLQPSNPAVNPLTSTLPGFLDIPNAVIDGVRKEIESNPPPVKLTVEEMNLKQALTETQNKLKSSEQMVSNYMKRLDSLQSVVSSSQPLSAAPVQSSVTPEVEVGGDETYRVRRADCDVMLKQRSAISSMSEDYAFIKYNRGKVPFNSEWAACQSSASAIDSLHCLDSWLLRHCRSTVIEGEDKWGDWVREVAVAYEGVLLPTPTPRNAYFIVACLHNNAVLLKGGYIDNLVVQSSFFLLSVFIYEGMFPRFVLLCVFEAYIPYVQHTGTRNHFGNT